MSVSSFQTIQDTIFAKTQCISHVHLVGLSESDLEEKLLNFNESESDKFKSLANGEKIEIGFVNCLCPEGNLKLFLNDLAKSVGITAKISDVDDLAAEIRKLIDKFDLDNVVFLLFEARGLLQFSAHARSTIFSLPKANKKIRLVTISEKVWELFEMDYSESVRPVQLFYNTSKDVDRIVNNLINKYGGDKSACKMMVDVLQAQTLDFHVAEAVWMDYLQHKQPITACLKNLEKTITFDKDNVENEPLPINLRLLLLASYFATHNSSTTDKRYFMKLHGREKRDETKERKRLLAEAQNENEPKSADMQRIYFIYTVLKQKYEEECQFSKNLHEEHTVAECVVDHRSQMTSLVLLGLITRTSAVANLDQPAYRCLISYDYAKELASSLLLNLDDYLDRAR